MYHLMLEIKTYQKVLDRRVKKLLEQLEKQHYSKSDADLLKEIKKQQTILDEKMLALMDLFELCHDKISPPVEKDSCNKDYDHKKLDTEDNEEFKIELQEDKEDATIEPKPLLHESLPPLKANEVLEQPPLGELADKGLGIQPLRLPPEPQEMDESSEHIPPEHHNQKGLGQHPSDLPPVLQNFEEPQSLQSEERLSADNQRMMPQTTEAFLDDPSATQTSTNAHGFAYSKIEGIESGVVTLNIAGPLQNMELVSNGLSVGNAGVYQVNYSVVLKTSGEVKDKAKFQMVINDKITIDSSTTESALSQQISSTQLFSLMEGDIVKLVAEIPEGMSYSQATLQIIQIA